MFPPDVLIDDNQEELNPQVIQDTRGDAAPTTFNEPEQERSHGERNPDESHGDHAAVSDTGIVTPSLLQSTVRRSTSMRSHDVSHQIMTPMHLTNLRASNNSVSTDTRDTVANQDSHTVTSATQERILGHIRGLTTSVDLCATSGSHSFKPDTSFITMSGSARSGILSRPTTTPDPSAMPPATSHDCSATSHDQPALTGHTYRISTSADYDQQTSALPRLISTADHVNFPSLIINVNHDQPTQVEPHSSNACPHDFRGDRGDLKSLLQTTSLKFQKL